MRALSSFDGVFLHREPVDMRKSIDGLSAIIRHEIGKPVCGRFLFVFAGRSRDRIKVLYFDRTGYALWYKRLEKAPCHDLPRLGDRKIRAIHALRNQTLTFLAP
jgi:transposase